MRRLKRHLANMLDGAGQMSIWPAPGRWESTPSHAELAGDWARVGMDIDRAMRKQFAMLTPDEQERIRRARAGNGRGQLTIWGE